MNDVTRNLKLKALDSTSEYMNQLSEDCLAYAKNFQNSINYLLENGKTEDGHIGLDDVSDSLGLSVFLRREEAEQAQRLLTTLTKDNVMDIVHSIYQTTPHFILFHSFRIMYDLASEFSICSDTFDEILKG